MQGWRGLGAERISVGQDPEVTWVVMAVTWVVMADPDGNEFCVMRALQPEEQAD